MTKEETLDKYRLRFGISQDNTQEEVEQAMEDYAKYQSIGFQNYIAENKYRWLKSSQSWTDKDDSFLTTEQLYDLFLQSQTVKP